MVCALFARISSSILRLFVGLTCEPASSKGECIHDYLPHDQLSFVIVFIVTSSELAMIRVLKNHVLCTKSAIRSWIWCRTELSSLKVSVKLTIVCIRLQIRR